MIYTNCNDLTKYKELMDNINGNRKEMQYYIHHRTITEKHIEKLIQLQNSPVFISLRKKYLGDIEVDFSIDSSIKLLSFFSQHITPESDHETQYLEQMLEFLTENDVTEKIDSIVLILFFCVYQFAIQQSKMVENIFNCKSGFYEFQELQIKKQDEITYQFSINDNVYVSKRKYIASLDLVGLLDTLSIGEEIEYKGGTLTLLNSIYLPEKVIKYKIYCASIQNANVGNVRNFVYSFPRDVKTLINDLKNQYGDSLSVNSKMINNNTTDPQEKNWLSAIQDRTGNAYCTQNGNTVIVLILDSLYEQQDKIWDKILNDYLIKNIKINNMETLSKVVSL